MLLVTADMCAVTRIVPRDVFMAVRWRFRGSRTGQHPDRTSDIIVKSIEKRRRQIPEDAAVLRRPEQLGMLSPPQDRLIRFPTCETKGQYLLQRYSHSCLLLCFYLCHNNPFCDRFEFRILLEHFLIFVMLIFSCIF